VSGYSGSERSSKGISTTKKKKGKRVMSFETEDRGYKQM
jgi:hypothetical protein